jgi:hypothetical protein
MKSNTNVTSVLIFVLSMGMGYSLFRHFILDKPNLDMLLFFAIGFLSLFPIRNKNKEFQSSN